MQKKENTTIRFIFFEIWMKEDANKLYETLFKGLLTGLKGYKSQMIFLLNSKISQEYPDIFLGSQNYAWWLGKPKDWYNEKCIFV